MGFMLSNFTSCHIKTVTNSPKAQLGLLFRAVTSKLFCSHILVNKDAWIMHKGMKCNFKRGSSISFQHLYIPLDYLT